MLARLQKSARRFADEVSHGETGSSISKAKLEDTGTNLNNVPDRFGAPIKLRQRNQRPVHFILAYS